MDRRRHYIFRKESVARAALLCSLFLPLLTAQTSSTLTVVYGFAGVDADGAYPYAGAVLSSAGIIFGTTEYGGTAGLGTVFQLSPPAGGHGAWTEKVIHNFTGTDGEYPYASLIIGPSGALFGTTTFGGNSGMGVVFQLLPPMSPATTWTLSILHSFSGADGAYPYGRLVFGTGGVVYGTTELGGASNAGTVFQLSPPTSGGSPWTETVLYSFSGSKDGGYPYGGLAFGTSGVLFGTTNWGGSSIYGTVFQLTPPTTGSTWTLTTLHSFTGSSDGANPFSNVVIGSGNALYGTTAGGIGAGNGTVFMLTPPPVTGGAWTETVLYSFTGNADGSHPRGSITIGKNGLLYGTTFAGGSAGTYSGFGTVFALTPPATSGGVWTETVLHTFTGGSDGGYPNGLLVPAPNGSYYGTSLAGGPKGQGTVFNINP